MPGMYYITIELRAFEKVIVADMQDYARIVHQRGVIFRALFHIKLSMH
jgi:hypothetical protein